MANDWYVLINDVEYGPISSDRLKLLAQQKKITPETPLKKGASSGKWISASHVKGLFSTAASPGMPAPAVPTPSLDSSPGVTTAKPLAPNAGVPILHQPPVATAADEKEGHLVRTSPLALEGSPS